MDNPFYPPVKPLLILSERRDKRVWDDLGSEDPIVIVLIAIEFLIILLCSLFSVYYLFKYFHCPLVILYFLLIAGPIGESRFKFPFLPFLYLLSAAGFLKIFGESSDKVFKLDTF